MAMTPDTQVRAQSLKAASFVGGSQQICKSIGRHGTATLLRHGGSSGATSAALLSIYDTWWHQQWHLGLSILFFFNILKAGKKTPQQNQLGYLKVHKNVQQTHPWLGFMVHLFGCHHARRKHLHAEPSAVSQIHWLVAMLAMFLYKIGHKLGV